MGTVGERSASGYDPLVGPSRSADGGGEATRCQTLDAVVPTDRENLVGKGTTTFRRSSSGRHRVSFYALVSQSVCFHAPTNRENLVGKGTIAFRQAQVGDIE
jgi:hypothetical protein